MMKMPQRKTHTSDDMRLPVNIQQAFSTFENLGCAIYLNASLAGLMSTSSTTMPLRGLHFVCVGAQEENLLACGFKKNVAHASLYTKLHHGTTLHCNRYTAREHWLAQHALESLAFSCDALFIDRHGRPYDPTGNAISDIMNGVLRPLHDPISLFESNISHLFDCMMHLANGYKPTSSLETAIHYWHPELTDFDEARRIIYHYLLNQTDYQAIETYACLLQDYGLTEKLFNMLFIADKSQLVNVLLQTLRIAKPEIQKTHLNNTHADLNDYSHITAQNPRLADWVTAVKNSLRLSPTLDALNLATPQRIAPK